MAEDLPAPLSDHWSSLDQIRRDHTAKRIVMGVDSGFARKWALGGRGCPLAARLASWVLLALVLLFVWAGTYVVLHDAAYLMGGFCLVGMLITWRLLTRLTVGFARATAVRDERLFRTWFDQRRLSILIRRTGTIVYRPGEFSDQ